MLWKSVEYIEYTRGCELVIMYLQKGGKTNETLLSWTQKNYCQFSTIRL